MTEHIIIEVCKVVRMEDGRIPKNLFYGELVEGKRPTGRPKLRCNDVCKRDLKALNIKVDSWEAVATECLIWRQTVQKGLCRLDAMITQKSEEKRKRRMNQSQGERPASVFIYSCWGKDCYSRIRLSGHSRCTRAVIQSATP